MSRKTVPCQLVGKDGNVYAVMGRAARALKRAGKPGDAKEMKQRALTAHSYDAALAIICEYVHDVSEPCICGSLKIPCDCPE